MTGNVAPNPGQLAGKPGPRAAKPGSPETAYAEALARFIENAEDMIQDGPRRFTRFTEDEITHGRTLMSSYFYPSEVEYEHPRVANAVRFGFALACQKYNLAGLPGQQREWYVTYRLRAQRFIQSAPRR